MERERDKENEGEERERGRQRERKREGRELTSTLGMVNIGESLTALGLSRVPATLNADAFPSGLISVPSTSSSSPPSVRIASNSDLLKYFLPCTGKSI